MLPVVVLLAACSLTAAVAFVLGCLAGSHVSELGRDELHRGRPPARHRSPREAAEKPSVN